MHPNNLWCFRVDAELQMAIITESSTVVGCMGRIMLCCLVLKWTRLSGPDGRIGFCSERPQETVNPTPLKDDNQPELARVSVPYVWRPEDGTAAPWPMDVADIDGFFPIAGFPYTFKRLE